MRQLSPLKYAVLIVIAPIASISLAQDGCETVDGPFGPMRICPVDPPPPRESPRGGESVDRPPRDRAAERAQAKAWREYKAAMKVQRRIEALIDKSNAEIDSGHYSKALELNWDAYRLRPDNPYLRCNVIRMGAWAGNSRGRKELLRGKASSIRDLEKLYHEMHELLQTDIDSVADREQLFLQINDLKATIADLRELERRRPPPPVEDLSMLIAENERRDRETGPLELAWDWAGGANQRENVFGMSNTITQDLRNSTHGRLARYYLYNKYRGRPRDGDSYTGYRGDFGLVGLFTTRTLSEQFVGSFRIDAEVKGNRIRYTATNTTSFTSAAYGKGPNWEANTFKPMSNMRQTYIWWEPVQRWPGSRYGPPTGAKAGSPRSRE